MPRTPFDLSFDELADAAAKASTAAQEEAHAAGVPLATLDAALPRSPSSAGWSNERVELLKVLWLDGQSASQIAKQLGGVTRNAVVSKVQRLGLSGRKITDAVTFTTIGSKPPSSAARYVEELPGVATVPTLGAHMCKWPIGDPALDNFTFCGRKIVEGGLYCAEHAELAYQPTQKKPRKSSATELARTLRRYI